MSRSPGADSAADGLRTQLRSRLHSLTDPAGDRRGALDCFRAAWPNLRRRLKESAAAGVDRDVVGLAGMAVHVLLAVADWAALEETSRTGLASAIRLGDDQSRLDLLQGFGVASQQVGAELRHERRFGALPSAKV